MHFGLVSLSLSSRVRPLVVLLAGALAVPSLPALAAKPKAAAAAPGKGDAPSPLVHLETTNADLKRLLQTKQKPAWSPEAELRNGDVKKLVDNLLDFEELGRRALAKHWDKLKPAERTDFVNTLRSLVERNYLKQMYGQPDYDLKLDKETITGDEAVVTSTLKTKRKGKKVQMAIEYRLVRKSAPGGRGRWVVYDIVTDDLSLLENYRAEFNKIINKDGFTALLGRMKKKLSEKG